MNYKIWFDKELGVARFKVLAMLTEEDVNEYIPGLNKLLRGKEYRCVLGDLSENPPGMLDGSARKAFKSQAKELDWDKIAFFGAAPASRMLAKAAVFALGMSKITRFFKTEEEAISWLKGEK
ncbi:STAS/SEC14 domain-containing protein [candidate division WOR-3 bacterium]|nr:STAS/SEC14 domain-containing protein [candidate division WOR-3 bacterium]